MEPIEVTSADFQRDVARYQKVALRQPVAVTCDGHESYVLLPTANIAD